jgi:hypothetical protein
LRPGRRPDRCDDDGFELVVVVIIVVIVIVVRVDDDDFSVIHGVDLDDLVDDHLGLGNVVEGRRLVFWTGDGVAVGIRWSASGHI